MHGRDGWQSHSSLQPESLPGKPLAIALAWWVQLRGAAGSGARAIRRYGTASAVLVRTAAEMLSGCGACGHEQISMRLNASRYRKETRMLFTCRNPQTQLDEERTALVAAGVQNGFLKPGASTHDELIETPSWSSPVPAGARFDSSRLGCSSRVRPWVTARQSGLGIAGIVSPRSGSCGRPADSRRRADRQAGVVVGDGGHDTLGFTLSGPVICVATKAQVEPNEPALRGEQVVSSRRWRTLRAIGCVGVKRSSAGATDVRQANV